MNEHGVIVGNRTLCKNSSKYYKTLNCIYTRLTLTGSNSMVRYSRSSDTCNRWNVVSSTLVGLKSSLSVITIRYNIGLSTEYIIISHITIILQFYITTAVGGANRLSFLFGRTNLTSSRSNAKCGSWDARLSII